MTLLVCTKKSIEVASCTNLQRAKRPFYGGVMSSERQNIQSVKCPREKCPSSKLSGGETFSEWAKCQKGETSINCANIPMQKWNSQQGKQIDYTVAATVVSK